MLPVTSRERKRLARKQRLPDTASRTGTGEARPAAAPPPAHCAAWQDIAARSAPGRARGGADAAAEEFRRPKSARIPEEGKFGELPAAGRAAHSGASQRRVGRALRSEASDSRGAGPPKLSPRVEASEQRGSKPWWSTLGASTLRPNVRAEPTREAGRPGLATDNVHPWLLPAQGGLPRGVGARARG